MSEPTRPAAHVATERLAEALAPLDRVAEPLGKAIRQKLGPGPVKDALSGTAMGHPAHPLLTDAVIGCLASATLLDLMPDRPERARRFLLAAGLASAPPTVASGWSDWADSAVLPDVRRLGFVHALVNATGLALYAASLATGRRSFSFAGAGLFGLGGFLGGHLSYAKGVGVNQTAFDSGPPDWTPALAEDQVPGNVLIDGVDVLIARDEGRIVAIANRCTHRGGPLSDGPIENGCVTCPWHGSVFRLSDGSVERGPAQTPQPVFETRMRDGQVEVRAAA